MESINIEARRPYKVGLGRGFLKDAAKFIRWEHPDGKVMILCDDNIKGLYLDPLMKSFQEEGYEVYAYTFEAGEKSKNLSTVDGVYGALSDAQFGRSDMIVCLGGGVCGDLGGFAASTYKRGIDYVQIPTSLLAMVDSSIGGKTGVNTSAGKNMTGTFYQPLMVLCDLELLKTLPEREYLCGLAEMIKYGVIAGEELFSKFEKGVQRNEIDDLVRMCIHVKKSYVEQDPYDEHMRRMLNLGHTIGHAVEAASGYEISHGEAISIGMQAMADAFDTKCADRLREVLYVCGISNLSVGYDKKTLLSYIAGDKKREAEDFVLIVPMNIGVCSFERVAKDEMENILEKVCADGLRVSHS